MSVADGKPSDRWPHRVSRGPSKEPFEAPANGSHIRNKVVKTAHAVHVHLRGRHTPAPSTGVSSCPPTPPHPTPRPLCPTQTRPSAQTFGSDLRLRPGIRFRDEFIAIATKQRFWAGGGHTPAPMPRSRSRPGFRGWCGSRGPRVQQVRPRPPTHPTPHPGPHAPLSPGWCGGLPPMAGANGQPQPPLPLSIVPLPPPQSPPQVPVLGLDCPLSSGRNT